MNISVFGLGYVGAVTAGCLGSRGHQIIGVDIHPQKIESFNAGIPPIVEPGLEELLKRAKEKGLLRATVDCDEAIEATELSIVCVGTPSRANGALDLSFVRGVVEQIGQALRRKTRSHTLVLRSTMLPGTTRAIAQELLSDLMAVRLLQVYCYPEFMRESTAVADFEKPSLSIVGTRDGKSPPSELLRGLFGENAAIVNWETAEMAKYACNAFHAAKVTFANEIGRVGKQMGLDTRVVMDLLCQDTKLNLSPYYLKPGNPFGGSCLPKDVRALTAHARVNGVSLPMLENLLPSNERHLQSLMERISESGHTEVCILGLSFKPNTDDLRESAMVEVAQSLVGRGYKLRVYDPALNLAALVGANKRAIDTRMPHLASVLRADLKAALGAEGLVVVAHQCVSLEELKPWVTARHHIIDVNGWNELRELPSTYEGLCW
jgi:GDP-mannose 6-dehydrogenase